MATNVKIRGLDRGVSASPDGSPTGGSYRGFKVQSSLGSAYSAGVKASSTVGTTTNGIVYTAKQGGTYGNSIQIAQAAAGTYSTVVTNAATTGAPIITVTPQTSETINQLVARVNADTAASQWVTASALTTGAGTTPATQSATAMTGGTNVGSAEPLYVKVSNKTTVVVDVDDPKTQRILKRNYNRYVSLGAA